jgi:preprotein translocase subunit SecG
MLTIVINLLTFVLILVSLFMLLVILMQRANSNAGMGSAFGGGVTESTFGAETTNILEKATKWAALAFFILALILYLLFMSREGSNSNAADTDLPDIPVVVEEVPAASDSPETGSQAQEIAEAGQAAEALATEAEATAGETLAEESVPATTPDTPPAP